jgi:hypothetical protein
MDWKEGEDHLEPHGVGLGGKLLILVVCPISSVLPFIARRKVHT